MKILIALEILTTLASCTMSGNQTPTPVVPVKQMTPDIMMPKTETMPKSDTMMKGDKVMMDTGTMSKESMMKSDTMTGNAMKKEEAKMMKPTGYIGYDEIKVKDALVKGQKVALFFAASWCPSCRALDASINSSISSIPQDALIVKVDYDTSDTLKRKYGVTSQHTTVLIDKDMSLISKKL